MNLGDAGKTKGLTTDAGLYNPTNSTVQTASPNYRFGSSQRPTINHKKSSTIPAPGHYTMSNGAFGKRGVLMGDKIKSLSSLNVPGAGTYAPDFSPTKTQSSRFSMGIKLKDFNKLNVPGPG